jgi:hypothetical protein
MYLWSKRIAVASDVIGFLQSLVVVVVCTVGLSALVWLIDDRRDGPSSVVMPSREY